MNLYSTVFININLIEPFFKRGKGVFLVLKLFYQFYTYFGSRVELVTKIPKSTPVMVNYACDFKQSETGKYFERIRIKSIISLS